MNEARDKIRGILGINNGDFQKMIPLNGTPSKYTITFHYKNEGKDGTLGTKEQVMEVAFQYNPFAGKKL
jgi:hypothetical protein